MNHVVPSSTHAGQLYAEWHEICAGTTGRIIFARSGGHSPRARTLRASQRFVHRELTERVIIVVVIIIALFLRHGIVMGPRFQVSAGQFICAEISLTSFGKTCDLSARRVFTLNQRERSPRVLVSERQGQLSISSRSVFGLRCKGYCIDQYFIGSHMFECVQVLHWIKLNVRIGDIS